jgi:hypothetical protein
MQKFDLSTLTVCCMPEMHWVGVGGGSTAGMLQTTSLYGKALIPPHW